MPVIASFAFDSGKNKDRTMMGATPEAVAANCGVGIGLSIPICTRLHVACDLSIWIKPNAASIIRRIARKGWFFGTRCSSPM